MCPVRFNTGQDEDAPEKCCFSFYTRPIPVAVISKYEETSNNCPRAGVVFTTRRGYRVCTDPSFKWVKETMDKIDGPNVEGSA
ncbi:C-C motif chemokine 4 homolog [Colossoma macropomum]|uniref:C-C motif chemokine 4 homolog n=1 Tax=Colossoma macropomum TaxID=42526 RepID=UPI0018641D0D|nr:C-C motif chemokine 4 homolog [Colossoma macropomum]